MHLYERVGLIADNASVARMLEENTGARIQESEYVQTGIGDPACT